MSTSHKKARKNSAKSSHQMESENTSKTTTKNGKASSEHNSSYTVEDMATGQRVSAKDRVKNGKHTGSRTVDNYTEKNKGDGKGYVSDRTRVRNAKEKKLKARVAAKKRKGALN